MNQNKYFNPAESNINGFIARENQAFFPTALSWVE
jgi:hypothetical protein